MLFHFCASLFHFSFFFVCVVMLRIGFLEVSLRKMLLFFLLLCIGMLFVRFSEILLRKMFAYLFLMYWYALYRLF